MMQMRFLIESVLVRRLMVKERGVEKWEEYNSQKASRTKRKFLVFVSIHGCESTKCMRYYVRLYYGTMYVRTYHDTFA